MNTKLPIGIQAFEKLRQENFKYVDKTEYIYNLVHTNTPYFLSRPRRFGKSLLLSTMKAYWEGRKELFEGLAIERLEEHHSDAWKPYPVFYFDFNGESYENATVEEVIDQHLSDWEKIYGSDCGCNKRTLGYRFEKLLEIAYKQMGRRSVVLVDEYDKPLLDVIDNSEIENQTKKVFKGFFSRLKKADEYIQFIFITGVTKFQKVSIFSDLNQLRDISMSEEYSGLCGITEDEIDHYFDEEITAFAERRKTTYQECREALRKQYDGYRFNPDGVSVYNPYSLLDSLQEKDFGSYWFETGTPEFLMKQVRKSNFDIRSITDNTLYATEATLKDYTGDSADPTPLLYQTGYLTIVGFDRKKRRYTLGFPNDEVKYGFLESLMPSYVPMATAGNKLDIFTLDEYVENGNLEGIRNVLTGLFANITYTQESDPFEHYFQTVIDIVFKLLGKFSECELHTYTGRIDCVVKTEDYIYLFEFKRDDTAKAALAQIDSKDYALTFVADDRKLYKIGVNFDSRTRKLEGWEVAE